MYVPTKKMSMPLITIAGFAIISLTTSLAIPEYANSNEDASHHMVGGTITNITSSPYVVSLQKSRRHFCSGTILTEHIILTAARCVVGMSLSKISIRVGSAHVGTGGLTYKIDKAVVHGFFRKVSEHNFMNDVALLKLKKPIKFFGVVQPVTLFNQNETIAGNSSAEAIGWGAVYDGPKNSVELIPDVRDIKEFTVEKIIRNSYGEIIERKSTPWTVVYPQFLRSLDLKVIEKDKCMETYDGKQLVSLEGQICAISENKETCSNDAGGPLIVDGRQAGIMSWNKGCEATEFPGVYSEVATYRDWIEHYKNLLPTT
ncbi:hypothetical protein QAD02_000295 [Eretmocerus hayati]|uniref:Uncharacterized protein n=1 Tax=Eretmocerus hayati TaxID=131215 RepID=A0ACC2ND74_9HYME|nr:hypothetical protein QAD02_000295 [Eretmocerus hayati]